MTEMKPTEFVLHVENTLGWAPPENKERWQVLALEASKLTKKMATDPKLYSWDNLLLAVELLRRERATVKSPVGVCWQVPRALKLKDQEQVSDLSDRVHAAVVAAFVAGEQDWVERLARATGAQARADVLAEWEAHRGT